MKKLLLTAATMSIGIMAPAQQAFAHVAYIDLMNYYATTTTTNGNSTTYYTAEADVVNGNFGWALAASPDWGDSHAGGWTKFEITNAGGAYVDLSVFSDGQNLFNPVLGIQTQSSDFNPAFTLYSGLVPDDAHDAAAIHPVPAGKAGNWNALGDTTMGNDYIPPEVATIHYLTHAAQDQNNLQNSISLNHYWLAQGVYSVVLGGDSALAAANPDADITPRGYGLSLTVTAVPVPAAAWLFVSALAGLVGFGRRKSAIAA